MSAKMVTMVKNGQEKKVVESSFEKVWKGLGWKLKGESSPAPKVEEVSEPEPEKKSRFSRESATE